MSWCRHTMWAAVAALALSGVAHADESIVLPRPGQIGVSLQGQAGTLLKSGLMGDLFDNGPGLAVRVRYRMRLERAVGLSFEGQSFDVRDRTPDSLSAPKKLKVILSGVEVYQMFGTRTKTTKMLSAGVGLAQASIDTYEGDTLYPGDGLYVSLGGGLEHFFWRSWAWDLGVRYQSVFQEQKVNHDFQASAGVIFYVSY